jgi:hypothetical protein
MNTKRLLELADRIETLPHEPIIETWLEETPVAFNMATWRCGTDAEITPVMAGAVIRNLAATGKVQWSIAVLMTEEEAA